MEQTIGEVGVLDYALSSPGLSPSITGIDHWHINTDEPDLISFDENFNPPGYFSPHQYRASDHDPVIVGMSLSVQKQYTVNTNGGVNIFIVSDDGRAFVKGDDVDGIAPLARALFASLWGARILSNGRITTDNPFSDFQIRAQRNEITRVAGKRVAGRYRWRFASLANAQALAAFLKEVNRDGLLEEQTSL